MSPLRSTPTLLLALGAFALAAWMASAGAGTSLY